MTKVIALGLFLGLVSIAMTTSRSYQLDDVLFELNSYQLTKQNVEELKIVKKTLREILAEYGHSRFTLWINGNADSTENDPKMLSVRRAKMIRKELINLGLTEGTLVAKGFGTSRPVTDSAAYKHLNARVDFHLRLE